MLYVSHDPVAARRLASRVAILDGGKLVHNGAFEELDATHESAFVRLAARELGL